MDILKKVNQDTYDRYGFDPEKSYHFKVDLAKLDRLEIGCFNRLSGTSGATGIADINYNSRWVAIKVSGQDFTVDNDKCHVPWNTFILWRKK